MAIERTPEDIERFRKEMQTIHDAEMYRRWMAFEPGGIVAELVAVCEAALPIMSDHAAGGRMIRSKTESVEVLSRIRTVLARVRKPTTEPPS